MVQVIMASNSLQMISHQEKLQQLQNETLAIITKLGELKARRDPDAPSRKDPKFREWHHWLVVNIPGTDISKGETLSEYVGACPQKRTGSHRYVFLVYKQPGKITDAEHGHLTNRSQENRADWRARRFSAKHHLGIPIAGNFFQAEWDDYVPKLYEQ